jgi:hypothetical protein
MALCARPGWPICETCGSPCKARQRKPGQPARFCSVGCIPRACRSAWGRQGRQQYIVTRRLRLFRSELQRLQALDRITAQELAATFALIADRCWDNGYSACETKWIRRMRQKEAA